MLKPTHSLPFQNISRTPAKFASFKEICEQRTLDEAFRSLGFLLSDPASLRLCLDDIYSPILDLCARKRALFQGKQIHSHVVKSCSLSDTAFFGTKLSFMYGKCGALEDAEKVFDGMPERTIFTWNAVIGAFVSNHEPLRALELYREMRFSGTPLDSYTFPCVLKACAASKDLCSGAEIHGLAIKAGFDSVSFVVNSLVSMYAKCGDLDGARIMFEELPAKDDIVLWNAMISAYSANGRSVDALRLFREAQSLNLLPNSYTFVSVLQACEDSAFEILGKEIHGGALKSSQSSELYVANALLAMYVRCGKIANAVKIFSDMERKDNVSYNTMLSGYTQKGRYEEAIELFRDMQRRFRTPDEVAILNIIAASGRMGNLLKGMEIHAHALKTGLDSNLQIGNTLIDMYARCRSVKHMGFAFTMLSNRDLISWTTIISGYAHNNLLQKAVELFREAQSEGTGVDSLMIESLLAAGKSLNSVRLVSEIHGYTVRRFLCNQVLKNSFVNLYGEHGHINYANRLFEHIECKDIVSWTSMLSCYVRNGLANEAFELLEKMKIEKVELDSVALISALSAAASLSALKKGKEIHGFLIRNGFSFESSVDVSLLEMYSKCGELKNACKVFDGSKDTADLFLCTAMINAYGMFGNGKKAIEVFSKMESLGIIPDHVAFLAILSACSHSGLVVEGKKYFTSMTRKYRLEPWPEHYACYIDLLGRANCLEEAYEFLTAMKTKPSSEVWCALLSACRVHSNKELGDIAARKLLESEPRGPGNYVLISNILAAEERWSDVKRVRTRMKGNGLKKNPGCSWIEIGNEVHTFIARDKSHPDSREIYEKLARVTEELKSEAGYEPRTESVLHDVEEEEKVEMLYAHSERLAISYGLIRTRNGTIIRIAKNLRVCVDCHTFSKLVSKCYKRELIVRDANRFHHFKDGICSCGDFW